MVYEAASQVKKCTRQQAPVLAACICSHLGELSSVAIRAIDHEVMTIDIEFTVMDQLQRLLPLAHTLSIEHFLSCFQSQHLNDPITVLHYASDQEA